MLLDFVLAKLSSFVLAGSMSRIAEKQQKSKQRGSAKFSLKQVVKDMNAEAKTEEEKIKYGVIIDDGDNIKEEN